MMYLFLALNLGLVSACLIFIVVGRYQPLNAGPPTNVIAAAATVCAAPIVHETRPSATVASERLISVGRTFDWRDVWSSAYPGYIEQLRRAGCPPEATARLVIKDVDDFYAQQRVEAAMTHDHEWWRTEPTPGTLPALQILGQALAQQRADLLHRLLGPANASMWRSEIEFWRMVPLTGTVLGKLTPEIHEQVQEIWARSQESLEGVTNAAALAKINEHTRRQLAAVLNPEQLEEFSLRYSSASQRLRIELTGLTPSPEEFRRIFAAITPLDERVAIEFGDLTSLSAKQRERHLQLRAEAIRAVLSPVRFEAYLTATRMMNHGS